MNIVRCGDMLDVIPKVFGRISNSEADFTFADFPFNIGQEYKGYDDRLSVETFERQIIKYIDLISAYSKVFALHGPDSLVDIFIAAQKKFTLKRIAWVNWYYGFGQCNRSNWIDSRCHCLIYSTEKNHTWNPDAVQIESERSRIYGDPRVNETERGGMRVPGQVWGLSCDGPNWGRIQGNSKERRPFHPNQLPQLYMERLIKAYTNAGDLVMDPCAGSGTTAVACKKLARSCISIDISKENCDSIRDRLRNGFVR